MNVRLRMYQVLLFKFGRHLCKGSMWPGFDSQTWRHTWVEFVDSPLCSKRFFSGGRRRGGSGTMAINL